MNTLLVLAYNEELLIEKTILLNEQNFDTIIVVNDKSTDRTKQILDKLDKIYKKIYVIHNHKNQGPGKSMQIGIQKAIELGSETIIKIDGDNQFDSKDVTEILNLANKNQSDFVKCDRFWSGGIIGKIPKIRYLGNAFASFLIKATSGNRNISDPLNGLFMFSKEFAKEINIPKFFNRYGYPFFVNLLAAQLSISKNYKLHQFKNIISYGSEKSKLNPLNVLFKLIFYSIYFSVSNIKVKLRYSNYQISALLDLFGYLMFLLSSFSLTMFLNTRFFKYDGNQNTWFILFILFFVLFVTLIIQSQKNIKNIEKSKFIYLN